MIEYTSTANIDFSKGIIILEFYARWCGTCRQVTKSIQFLEETYPYSFVRVNTETEKAFTNLYHVQGIPVIVILKDGMEMDRIVGSKTISELKLDLDSLKL